MRPIIWVFELIQNFPVPSLTDRWKNTERAGPAAKLPMGGIRVPERIQEGDYDGNHAKTCNRIPAMGVISPHIEDK